MIFESNGKILLTSEYLVLDGAISLALPSKLTQELFVEKIDADAIVVLTRSGFTANLISRARPKVPVYAFTNNKETQGKLSLASSVENLFMKFGANHEKTINSAFNVLKDKLKLRGRKKFVVISGIFSDIYADAIQIRFMD